MVDELSVGEGRKVSHAQVNADVFMMNFQVLRFHVTGEHGVQMLPLAVE